MQFVTTRYRKRSVFVRHSTQHHFEERSMPEVSQFYVDHREYREEIVKEKVMMKHEGNKESCLQGTPLYQKRT